MLGTVRDPSRRTVRHTEPRIVTSAAPAVLVLTNSRSRGTLTAVRSLAAGGWRVGVGSPDGDGLAARSRACDARHAVPRPRRGGEEFVARVRELVVAHGYDLVVGAADDWATACATWADELPCTVGHPGAQVMHRATDKLLLADLARRHGIAAPRTVPATETSLASWDGPVVVKCRTHWQPGADRALRIEARLHERAADAARSVALIRDAGLEPLLQEPVAGRLTALIGLVVDGRLTGRVQQVASGTWPTPLGVSSRAVAVPVDECLADRAGALLAELGWEGLVELQLLVPDRGEPLLIDLNGRYFGSMALSRAAGVDLADLSARLALGQHVEDPPDGRVGTRYAWIAGDLRRAWHERRGGLVRDVLTSLRWAATADTASVLTVRDPAPAWWLATQRIGVGRSA